MEKYYFGDIRSRFERFRNFQAKPKGGPQALLALAKGSPERILKKFKKCYNAFQSLKKSSKTIFLMEKNYFGDIRRRFERFRNFQAKPKGRPQALLALEKGGPQGIFKKFKKCLNPFQSLKKSYKTIF